MFSSKPSPVSCSISIVWVKTKKLSAQLVLKLINMEFCTLWIITAEAFMPLTQSKHSITSLFEIHYCTFHEFTEPAKPVKYINCPLGEQHRFRSEKTQKRPSTVCYHWKQTSWLTQWRYCKPTIPEHCDVPSGWFGHWSWIQATESLNAIFFGNVFVNYKLLLFI